MFQANQSISFRFILLLILLNAFSRSVHAQKEDITMRNILSISAEYVESIEMELGQEIVRMEFDIVSNSKTTYRMLSSNYEYGILAFGESRIEDIDIKVYKYVNDQWSLVAQDEDEAEFALVSVQPLSSATYRIEISAYRFADGYSVGHYGLLIFHP
jgi:hypothetical protein